MRTWEPRCLNDLCSLITDGKHGDCQNEEDSGYYFISAKDIYDGKIHYENARQITQRDFAETHRRTNLRPGDILLTNSGTIGRLAIASETEASPNTTFQKSVAILKPIKDRILSEFLYYSLEFNTTELINASAGAAQKNLLLGELRKFAISVPTIPIQKRITNILSNYDKSIENNSRRIQLLEQSAQLLYREWFVHLRFPGHEHVRIINGVPEEWENRIIGELTVVVSRGITPIYDDEGEFTVINQKCIRNRDLNFEFARRQIKEFKEEKQVRFGDVLINSTGTGTLGRVAQLWINFPKCTVDSHVTIVRPKEDLEKVWFGFSLLPLENIFESMGEGSTNQTELNPRKIREITVLLPRKELRLEFEEFATNIINQINNLKSQNIKLARARNLLLPRLMNGEITV
jgi:type I restriction enzyme S subunit